MLNNLQRADWPFRDLFFGIDDTVNTWKSFYPELPLSNSENTASLTNISNKLVSFFQKLQTNHSNELDKVEWLVFSLWDYYNKDNEAKFIFHLYSTERQHNQLVFKAVDNTKGRDDVLEELKKDDIYSKYVNWIGNYQKEREESALKPIHFWDFIHAFRKFEWGIVISEKDDVLTNPDTNNLFKIKLSKMREVNGSTSNNLKNPKTYDGECALVHPDFLGCLSTSLTWWYWEKFVGEFGANNTETADDFQAVFEKLVVNYYAHLGTRRDENNNTKAKVAPYIYEFPIWLDVEVDKSESNDTKLWYRSVATVSVGASKPLSYPFWEFIVHSRIKPIYQVFLTRSFFDQSKLATLRAAQSAIMARNMSHNIGSHVIPRTSISKIMDRLSNGKDEALDKFKNKLNLAQQLKDKLDLYIQCKSDFLAEIATDPLLSVKHVWFYREVILPFVENQLIIDNLAASEGIHCEQLIIHCFINGKELKTVYTCKGNNSCSISVSYPDKPLPYGMYCEDCGFQQILELKEVTSDNHEQDVLVALPGPLGEFAIYSILENIIRNTAKHQHENLKIMNPKKLEIFLSLYDENGTGQYTFEIRDNLTKHNEPLVTKLKKYITDIPVDKQGRLKREAWGINEIKVCSALLSGSVDTFNSRQKLQIIPSCSEDENKFLSYKLELCRSIQLCILHSKMRTNKQQNGIHVFNTLDKCKEFIDSHANSLLSSPQFVVIDLNSFNDNEWPKKDMKENLEALRPKLPFRTLVLYSPGEDEENLVPDGLVWVKQSLSNDDAQNPVTLWPWIWKYWLESKWLTSDKPNAVVDIYLGQTNDSSPTDKWASQANKFNQNNPVKVRVWAKSNNDIEPITNNDFDSNSNNHILYDRHGALFECISRDHGYLKESYHYLDKLSPDFNILFHPPFPSDNKPWHLPWQMAEAGLIKILLVDERLTEFAYESPDVTPGDHIKESCQEFLKSRYNSDFSNVEILRWHMALVAHIYICTHFGIDNSPEPLYNSRQENTSKSFLKIRFQANGGICTEESQLCVDSSQNPITQNDFHILIIHQGILEKYLDKAAIKNFLDRTRSNIPFIVVTSGRGIPPQLPETEKFIPFSTLEAALKGTIGKLGLIQQCLSLTRWKDGSQ